MDAQGSGTVYVVQIRGEIDLGLPPYVDRVLQQAQRDNAQAVILDIDTPGGRLDAALRLRDSLIGSPVRTIAYVNRNAFSAGALIAIAANGIYLAPGAVIGAATPVTGSGEQADEKVVSAVRSTFRSTAELRGRNPQVAEAMVDRSVAIDGLVTADQLLTLTAGQAQAWGYADGIASSREQLLRDVGLAGATIHESGVSFAENLVRFLTNPVVASLLISLGLLLLATDLLNGGGVGIAAAAGLALLALFFWGHLIAGLAGWEGVALVALGSVLLALEVFVFPGFGIAGVLGIIALLGGLFLSLIGGPITTDQDLTRAAGTIAGAILFGVVGGALLVWILPRTGRVGGLILLDRLSREESRPPVSPTVGQSNGSATGSGLAGRFRLAAEPRLTGMRGVTVTDLRPGGIARIGDRRVDVLTEGEYLNAGEPIIVVQDEVYRRVVRKVAEGENAGDQTPGKGSAIGLRKGSGDAWT